MSIELEYEHKGHIYWWIFFSPPKGLAVDLAQDVSNCQLLNFRNSGTCAGWNLADARRSEVNSKLFIMLPWLVNTFSWLCTCFPVRSEESGVVGESSPPSYVASLLCCHPTCLPRFRAAWDCEEKAYRDSAMSHVRDGEQGRSLPT